MTIPDDLTDDQRILVVEAAYRATPGTDRDSHRAIQGMLADGVPMDQVVEFLIGVAVEGARSLGHPVARAAAMLCQLDKIPGWVYTPFDEAEPTPASSGGVPADLIRDAVLTALDGEDGYRAEMHARVRQIMTMTTADDAFERLALLAVELSRGKYDDYRGRAAEIEWHMKMIPRWMAERLVSEN